MKNICFLLFFFSCTFGFSQPDIDFTVIANGLNRPVDLTGAGDGSDRLFVVEKRGVIKIIDLTDNSILPTDFLDIQTNVDDNSNEQGLLGLVFDPNYASNGYFYVNYTYDPGPGLDRTRVSRFSVSGNPNVASAGSESIIIEIEQDFGNHNAGDLVFGRDGYLYIPLGDGGSGGDPNCNAQDPMELLGKMLRIDVHAGPPGNQSELCGLVNNYGIPGSNPFADPADGVCDEIWAVGLRNPWRVSFDAVTSDLWIADVGQNNYEEINFQSAGGPGGGNYGWKIMEASSCYDPDPIDDDCPSGVPSCFDASFTDPVFEYSHAGGNCSVTGGFRYRGSDFPGMQGHYVFMDYCSNRLWTLYGSPGSWNSTVKVLGGYGNIATFGEDDNREMYSASDGTNGSVYKVVDLNIPVGVDLLEFKAKLEGKSAQLTWTLSNPSNFSHFIVEKSLNAKDFERIGKIEYTEKKSYSFTDSQINAGNNFYRLKLVDFDGKYQYSRTISIPYSPENTLFVYPNPVKNTLTIELKGGQNKPGIEFIKIYSYTGKKVLEFKHPEAIMGEYAIQLDTLNTGIYLMTIQTSGGTLIQKFYKE